MLFDGNPVNVSDNGNAARYQYISCCKDLRRFALLPADLSDDHASFTLVFSPYCII